MINDFNGRVHPCGPPQGSITSRPIWAKSLTFLVAQAASCARQIAAICASAVLMGNPAASRMASTSAYLSAAMSSKASRNWLPRYGVIASSILCANSSLRRPSGSLRTPASSSAKVMEVIATSAVKDSSHSTTRGLGEGRKTSEMTFVSRTIMRSPPPLRCHRGAELIARLPHRYLAPPPRAPCQYVGVERPSSGCHEPQPPWIVHAPSPAKRAAASHGHRDRAQ